MMTSDPIADLLTRIRNAQLAKHDRLEVPASKLKLELCRILAEQGFIEGYDQNDQDPVRKQIRIRLRYSRRGDPAIRHLERVSKPGRRVYRRSDEIRPVLNGLGVSIVSTSRGILTDREARDQRVGGEVLCRIW